MTLTCQLRGTVPPPLDEPILTAGWRCGIDLHPIDLTDSDDMAWLRALVWADHPDRACRLDQATQAAMSGQLPPIHAGDVFQLLPDVLATTPPEAVACVFHTATLAHFSSEARERFEHLVAELSGDRPICWLQAEPRPGTEPRLRLTWCEYGHREHTWALGHYHPHGAWIEWIALNRTLADGKCTIGRT